MNQFWALRAAMIGFMGLGGVAQAAGVATHAYVYIDADGSADRTPTVLLDQGGAIGALSCQLGQAEAMPATSAELTSLVTSTACSDSLASHDGDSKVGLVRVYHPAGSDRLIFNMSSILWGAQASASDPSSTLNIAGTSIFDRVNSGQFNALYTFIQTPGAKNSTVTTGSSSYLRAYDAVIQYAALPANVIEQ